MRNFNRAKKGIYKINIQKEFILLLLLPVVHPLKNYKSDSFPGKTLHIMAHLKKIVLKFQLKFPI